MDYLNIEKQATPIQIQKQEENLQMNKTVQVDPLQMNQDMMLSEQKSAFKLGEGQGIGGAAEPPEQPKLQQKKLGYFEKKRLDKQEKTKKKEAEKQAKKAKQKTQTAQKENKKEKKKEEKPKTNKQLEKEKKQRISNSKKQIDKIKKMRDKLGDEKSKEFVKYKHQMAQKTKDKFADPQNKTGADAMIYYSTEKYEAMNSGLRTNFKDGQATGTGEWSIKDKNTEQKKYIPGAMQKTKEAIEFLNRPENVAESDMTVTRHMNLYGLALTLGLDPNVYNTMEKFQEIQGINEGIHIAKDEGFVSTTLLRDGAVNFAKPSPVECRMLIPKGTHGLYIDPISDAGDEMMLKKAMDLMDSPEDFDGTYDGKRMTYEEYKKQFMEDNGHEGEQEFLMQAGSQFKILNVAKEQTKYGEKLVVYMEALKDNVYRQEKLNSLKDSNAA